MQSFSQKCFSNSGVARRRKVGAQTFYQKSEKQKKNGHSGVKPQERGYCG